MREAKFKFWLGLLLPAIGWFLQLNVSYFLSAYACQDKVWTIHAVSIIALLINVTGLYFAYKAWKSEEKKDFRLGSFLLGLIFFLMILLGEASNLFMGPCL